MSATAVLPTVTPEPETLPDGTRPGQVPFATDGLGSFAYWRGEIQAAEDQIEKKIKDWRTNLARYQNQPFDTAPEKDTIWVPKDYALTERKRSQLWYRLPELYCQPKPGQSPTTAQAAPVFAAVLNQKIGPDGFDFDTMMTEATFDAICPSGLMAASLSYVATVDGQKPVTMGAGVTTTVPNIIHEQYDASRVSSAFLILPPDWVGSKYDKAPYLGYRFEMDREIAKRRWELTDEDLPSGREPLKTLNEAEEKLADRRERKVVTGVFLEYKASIYDPAVKHPQRLRELVIFDGADTAAVHRDSPYQTVTATGHLSGDSVKVFTTRVATIRTISDGKFPNSDCQQSRPQVDELSKGRTQMIQQRNRNIPLRAADKTRIDKTVLDKIAQGVYQEIILVDGPADDVVHEIARAQFPRENFAFNDQIEQDLEETWALGENQLASSDDQSQTATEASIKQRNMLDRVAKEQQRVKDFFLGCVDVAATMIQRYADATDYVEIVGPVGAQILAQSALLGWVPDPNQAADPTTATTVAWNKTMVQGSFLWTIKPDAQLRTDMTQERQFRRQAYNQYRRDPLVNARELLKWALEAEGLQGEQFLAPQQPPPEPVPAISVSIKGEDLIPFAPQYPNIVQLLTVDGQPAQLAPVAMQPAVPHPGVMPGAEPLNKHQADLTGNLPGPSGEMNTGGV